MDVSNVSKNVMRQLAEEAYASLAGEGDTRFEDLYDSARVFYSEVAKWHLEHSDLLGDIEYIASKLFERVMIYEQKRRLENRPIQNGGLIIMNWAVKDNYYELAKWHIELAGEAR